MAANPIVLVTAAPVEAPAADRVIYEKIPGGMTEAFTAAGEDRAA